MSNAPTTRAVRLALAVSAVRAARAIDAATNLAAALHAELSATYVRDEDLLRAAALPCTFEIGSLASGARPFGLAQIERALKREAADVEQAVSEAARKLGLGWTFEVLRGRAIDWPFERAGVDDITVIGKAGLELQAARTQPLYTPGQPDAPILAIIDATPGSLERLDRMLQNLGGTAALAVWTPDSIDRNAQATQQALRAMGKESNRAIRHLDNTEAFSAASLGRVMRTLRPGVVVIARSLAERIRAELPVVLRLVAGTMIFAP
jgi:nucleotide-binding universal stress UspA family protein